MSTQGPSTLGRGGLLDEQTARRARSVVATLGRQKASRRLRMGTATLEAACGRSRMTPEAAARLRAALDREEPLLLEAAS